MKQKTSLLQGIGIPYVHYRLSPLHPNGFTFVARHRHAFMISFAFDVAVAQSVFYLDLDFVLPCFFLDFFQNQCLYLISLDLCGCYF